MGKPLVVMIISIFCISPIFAANKTISNTGGNWGDNSTWVEGSPPNASEDVIATATSGNVVINVAAVCRSINLTNYVGTLTHNAAIKLSIGDGTAGTGNVALKFVAGMSYVLLDNLTSEIEFVSTSATVQTIDFGGKLSGNISYNGVGGSWQLISAHSTNIKTVITISNGTFDTNGQTCVWGYFKSSNSNTRTLTFGNSSITLNGGSNGNYWDTGSVGNLTVTANTATVTVNKYSSNWGATFKGASKNWNGLSLAYTGGGSLTIVGSNIFQNFTYTGNASYGGNDRVQLNSSFTVLGSLNVNGGDTKRVRLFANSGSKTITMALAVPVTMSYVNMDGIQFSTARDLSASTGGVIDDGNNSGNITFSGPIDCYWKSTEAGDFEWTDASKWFTTSGGTISARVPTKLDNAIFDANSIGAANTKIFTISHIVSDLCRDLTWTGVTNNPTLEIVRSFKVYGNVTLDSGMVFASSSSGAWMHLKGNGTGQTFTYTSDGVINPSYVLNFNPDDNTATYELGDELKCRSLAIQSGTFNTLNNNVTTKTFAQVSANPTINMGSGTWDLTGVDTDAWTSHPYVFKIDTGTINKDTSTIKLSDNTSGKKTIVGNGKTFNDLLLTGSGNAVYEINDSNTFNSFSSTKTVPYTIQFEDATTTTVSSFSITGAADKFVTIRSIANASHTLTLAATATVNSDYLHISNSTIIGNGNWLASTNSIDGGNNSVSPGWVFGSASTAFTWKGTTDNDWSVDSNWVGNNAPGENDIAYFTGDYNVACNIDAAISVKGIHIGQTYTQTITQANTITLGTAGFLMDNGTFIGATQSISSNGPVIYNDGSFKLTSANFQILAQSGGTLILNGSSFDHNSGTITITGSNNCQIFAPTASSLNDLVFNCTGAPSGTIYLDGDLTRSTGTTWDANTFIDGDYLGSGAGGSAAGTGTITFAGTLAQSFAYPYAPSVKINKSSGTLNIPEDITVSGNWDHSTGTLEWNDKKVTFNSDNTSNFKITKGVFYDIELNADSATEVTISSTATVANDFTLSSLFEMNGDDLEISGDYTMDDSIWTGTGKLVFTGSGTSSVSGSGKQGVALEVNKDGSVLLLAALNVYNSGHDLIVNDGKLVLNANHLTVADEFTIYDTLVLKGNETITVNGTTATADANAKFTISATNSTIEYTDSGVTATVTNLAKTYYSLVFGASKIHEFATGPGNGITINGTLASNGYGLNLSILRSASDAATDWHLTLNGTSNLSNKVNVKRSDASANKAVLATGSIDGGNNTNWLGLGTSLVATSLTSSTADGNYKLGDIVNVTLTFNRAVTLIGNITVTLDTGGTATISSFVGTSATANYTISAGHSSSDLTATAVSMTGTATDSSNTSLALSLPSTNIATGSAIVVDGDVPIFSSSSFATSNAYVDVVFSEGVYSNSAGTGPLVPADFSLVFAANSGNSSAASISSVTSNTGAALVGGETTVRLNIAITGTPSGVETITITPAASAIFDNIGNTAAISNTTGALILKDQLLPSVTSVNSSTADGSYNQGEILIQVIFSETVTVTGEPKLLLETGATDQSATYSSGSGSNTLSFTYNIQSGDTSADLDYGSVTALTLNGGSIIDASSNAAVLTLASPAASGSLSFAKAFVIDTTAPKIVSHSLNANNSFVDLVFSEALFTDIGTGAVLATDLSLTFAQNTGSATSASITSISSITGTELVGGESSIRVNLAIAGNPSGAETITITPVSGAIYDFGGNSLATTESTGEVNLLPIGSTPNIIVVISSNLNGTYSDLETVAINVVFSEIVNVSGFPTLLLETGSEDRLATYASGSGSATLVFNYIIQINDESLDLDYASTGALELGTSSLNSANEIPANLSLPAVGGVNSLSGNSDIVVNTDAPLFLGISTLTENGTYGLNDTIDITISFNKPVSLTGGNLLIGLSTGRSLVVTSLSGKTISASYIPEIGEFTTLLDIETLTLEEGAKISDASAREVSLDLSAISFSSTYQIGIDGSEEKKPSKSSGGGCSYNPHSSSDYPLETMLILMMLGFFYSRKYLKLKPTEKA